MLDDPRCAVKGDEVIVLVVPAERERRYRIRLVLFWYLFDSLGRGEVDLVLVVDKADLPVGGDGVVKNVDAVVYLLVDVLDAVGDKDLPPKLFCVVFADEVRELDDKLKALFARDELRALNRVDEELQLGFKL